MEKWPIPKLYISKGYTNLQLTTFSSEIIYPREILFEFFIFEIQIFQTTLNGEITKTKVVVLNNVYNFVVEKLFFWIRLRPKIHIPRSDEVNKRGMFLHLKHTRLWGWSGQERCYWFLGSLVLIFLAAIVSKLKIYILLFTSCCSAWTSLLVQGKNKYIFYLIFNIFCY